jgi:hypothetical protein
MHYARSYALFGRGQVYMTVGLHFYSHATLFDVRNTFLVRATLFQLFQKYSQAFK